MALPFLLSTFQSAIVNLQIHSESEVSRGGALIENLFKDVCNINTAGREVRN
jgi:hypothetical protein